MGDYLRAHLARYGLRSSENGRGVFCGVGTLPEPLNLRRRNDCPLAADSCRQHPQRAQGAQESKGEGSQRTGNRQDPGRLGGRVRTHARAPNPLVEQMLPAAEPAGAFRSPREGPNLEGLRRIDGRHLAFSSGPGESDNDVQIHVPE